MNSIHDMTPNEVNELNEQTRADLNESVEKYETNKTATMSSAIEHLINVTEAETIDIIFSSPAGESVIKVMASPPQKVLEELFQIGSKAEGAQETSPGDERKLCKILEYICIEPKIPFKIWKSGKLSDEIPARIIFELMKHKVTKHETMVAEVESFRPNKRGATNTRGVPAPPETTE